MTSTSAHVVGCGFPRCAHQHASGLRCFRRVDRAGDRCVVHAPRLPRELVVLRDSRTGEPLEVT